MRIIGGKYKGSKLADIGEGDMAAHLRPSSDRARESVFNILNHPKFGNAPRDMRVLDVFAGTGALGFEALSRGASHVSFVENGAISNRILKQNIKILDASKDTQLINSDVLMLPMNKSEPFDLVFMDPPYGMGLGESAILNLKQNNWLANNALIVWEEATRPLAPHFLTLIDQRTIGRAVLSFFRYHQEIKNG